MTVMDAQPTLIELQDDALLEPCAEVIRAAFATVADARGLTHESAPTFPAWLTADRLREARAKGTRCFAAMDGPRPVGFAALEAGREAGVFYLERLAVLPAVRHAGLGRRLVEHAAAAARAAGAAALSIGIIDDELVLKRWYETLGFTVTSTRRFPHLPFTVCYMERKLR